MATINVELKGQRPLMFDRYAGDNNTSLPVMEKLYLSEGFLIMPAINIYSLLCAENTKSVCRQFFGRSGKTIGLGIGGFTSITPFDIPILNEQGPIRLNGSSHPQISIHKAVARLPKGIPNPKERPVLALPWLIRFQMEYIENQYCTLENLRQAFDQGGILGLGTFRPFFGRYLLTRFVVE